MSSENLTSLEHWHGLSVVGTVTLETTKLYPKTKNIRENQLPECINTGKLKKKKKDKEDMTISNYKSESLMKYLERKENLIIEGLLKCT